MDNSLDNGITIHQKIQFFVSIILTLILNITFSPSLLSSPLPAPLIITLSPSLLSLS